LSKKAHPAEHLSAKILELADEIESAYPSSGDAKKARQFHARILQAYSRLKSTVESLDPINQPSFVFEPSNPNLAGKIAGLALIAQPRQKLTQIARVYGSGVYAIYYNGDFEAYSCPTGHIGNASIRSHG
jgi:hypothetical protein